MCILSVTKPSQQRRSGAACIAVADHSGLAVAAESGLAAAGFAVAAKAAVAESNLQCCVAAAVAVLRKPLWAAWTLPDMQKGEGLWAVS